MTDPGTTATSASPSGQKVNWVEFATTGGGPRLGTLRQVGDTTWNEDSETSGRNRFEFQETARTDTSVTLLDIGRQVRLVVDLERGVITYSEHGKAPWDLFAVIGTGTRPTGWLVNRVDFGGNAFKKIGHQAWQFDTVGGINEPFDELRRDDWSVYLADRLTGSEVQLDLHRGIVSYKEPITGHTLECDITATSAALNGWTVTHITTTVGGLRQTGWDTWVQDDLTDGINIHSYDEVQRDDWSVYLYDPYQKVNLQIDLHTRTVYYTSARVPRRAHYDIVDAGRGPEFWRHLRRISSRSSLTHDYQVGKGGNVAVPVYRTTVTLPPHTTHLDIWASEETTVEVAGRTAVIDAVKFFRVIPSEASRVTISIPATDLHCPSLQVRTNLMKPGHRHPILPDVEVHRKVQALRPGALQRDRGTLGIHPALGSSDLDQIQTAVQNLARANQYSYNDSDHGVHHDRAVRPANMQHPHFVLDFGTNAKSASAFDPVEAWIPGFAIGAGVPFDSRPNPGPVGGLRYSSLQPHEVHAAIRGARLIEIGAAQGLFDDIGRWLVKAGRIIVHTAERVADDVLSTAAHVVSDVVTTVERTGEHLVHGDLLEATKDLVQGGENLGTDLVKGALSVGGDLLTGTGRLLVVTVEAGAELVQFVLEKTAMLGHVITSILNKIGVTAAKAVRWLLDAVGWEDVLATHRSIRDSVNHQFDLLAQIPLKLEKELDDYFAHLGDEISAGVDAELGKLHVPPVLVQPEPSSAHSFATEQMEWLLGKVLQHSKETDVPALQVMPTPDPLQFSGFLELLTEELGEDGSRIRTALGSSLGLFQRSLAETTGSTHDLLAALLELVKGIALLGIKVIGRIADALLELVASMILGVKAALNEPWDIPFVTDFYRGLTGQPTMTMLGVLSLLVAIPATLIHQAVYGRPPATLPLAVMSAPLPPLTHTVAALGFTYGATHLVMAPVSLVGIAMEATRDVSGMATHQSKQLPTEGIDKVSAVAKAISLCLGTLAQFTGAPVQLDYSTTLPTAAMQYDTLEAPAYWTRVIWWYQNAGLFFDVITSGVVVAGQRAGATELNQMAGGDLICAFTGLYGLVHMCLMGVLDAKDAQKTAALRHLTSSTFTDALALSQRSAALELETHLKATVGHQPMSPVAAMTEEEAGTWISGLHTYLAWGTADENQGLRSMNLTDKGFGNVMDTFPEIAQFGVMPSVADEVGQYSLPIAAFMSLLGHLGEGITYMVRTGKSALF